MHRSLNAGHRANHIQSVTDRTSKRDILVESKDVLRRFSQKHLNIGKHKVKLTKKSAYDKIKKRWTETYYSIGGWLRSRSDLR